MAGPFDRFQSPWYSMRESQNLDDRREDPWPWHALSPQSVFGNSTPTLSETANIARGMLEPQIPPITNRLQQQAGTGDVGPISSEELMKFLLDIENMNPPPEPLQTHNKRMEPYNGRR